METAFRPAFRTSPTLTCSIRGRRWCDAHRHRRLSFIFDLDAVLRSYPPSTFDKYRNRVKLGGVKITLDGSPQGRTAYFTTPYLADGPEGQHNWRGEQPFPREAVNRWFNHVYDLGLQLLIHANGDAAIDMLLDAHEAASAADFDRDRRTFAIHSQFVRRDQLQRYLTQQVIPSFFTSHAYYFADAHIRLRGRAQADFLSPMRAVGLLRRAVIVGGASCRTSMVLWKAARSSSWMVSGPRNTSVQCTVRRRSPLRAARGVTANAGRARHSMAMVGRS